MEAFELIWIKKLNGLNQTSPTSTGVKLSINSPNWAVCHFETSTSHSFKVLKFGTPYMLESFPPLATWILARVLRRQKVLLINEAAQVDCLFICYILRHKHYTTKLFLFSLLLFNQVLADNTDSISAEIRKRLTGDDPDLTADERLKIRQFLETFPDDDGEE